MKAYTDLSQSKKLAEILPLESADMHYNNVSIKGINYVDEHRAELMEYNRAIKVLSKYTINPLFKVVPCWSLAALIDSLPLEFETHKQTDGYKIYYYVESYMKRLGKEIYLSTERHENLVDACYEMIIKLHELNLL